MRIPIFLLCVPLFLATLRDASAETAADIATRHLLDALEERQMPDVSLAVLERVTADANASPELKKEVPLRRAAALVAMSKTEGDSKKRAILLDDAQKALDTFLASGQIEERQAIAAYTQKGNLLVERGRAKADQATRPGADEKALRAEAIKFFDEAIKSLKGTAKEGEEIKAVTNAEDAVLKVLRPLTKKVKALKAREAATGGERRPGSDGLDATKRAQRTAAETARAAKVAADEAAFAQAQAAQAAAHANAAQAAAAKAGRSPQAGALKKAAEQAVAAKNTADTIAGTKVAQAKAANEKMLAARKAAADAVAAEKGTGSTKGQEDAVAGPAKLTPQELRDLAAMTEELEALQGKLLQTRMTTAAAVFEKAKAYPEKSKEWTTTITDSATLFKELADKYPSKGAGLLARYYEGRNYALLGNWDNAITTLAPLVAIEAKIPLAILIRSRALNTTLEAFIAQKKYDLLDDSGRKFALEDLKRLPGAKLDADWLGLKYRAAVILDARADALDTKDPKNKNERNRLQADAKKLVTEVAKANADFASEARELSAKLGKPVVEGERTFQAAWDDAQVAIATMQQRLFEEKQAVQEKDAAKIEAAKKASAAARDEVAANLEEAMKLAGIAEPRSADRSADDQLEDATIDQINQARYLLTFLLYSGEKFGEAATLGRLLVEHYPQARVSRQAATIVMSSLQQMAQRADEGTARDDARQRTAEFAGIVMRAWPEDSGDAVQIAIGNAVAARDPAAIIKLIDQTSPSAPQRGEVLLRAGTALWREVMEARRSDAGFDANVIEGWKARARKALDEGLASVATAASLPEGTMGSLAVAGALSRVQIAMDDDDTTKALAVLQQPVYGPWTLVASKSPVLQQGPLAEASLTLALPLFIQAEKFDQAQQAMDGLEKAAGTGAEASAKLTSMYLAMSRDLQTQLEQLAAGKADDPQVRAKADRILNGFKTFLDRVAKNDPKISSQFWVATTYLTLGSGKGTGAVVSKDKATGYLQRAAEVYEKLLQKSEDPDVARFVPSIRLRMANIYQELRQWDQAQEQLDWYLSDSRRQNSLDTQIQAAELLQAAADDAARNGDAKKANDLYRDAVGGRKAEPVVIWGWGNIANRLARQGFSGADERSRQSRDAFFNARFRVVECLLARARLPGNDAEKKKRLETADTTIAFTHTQYPDLGGKNMFDKFDGLMKQIQKERGEPNPVGLAAFQKKGDE